MLRGGIRGVIRRVPIHFFCGSRGNEAHFKVGMNIF
jgi:hypothetical protein